MDRVAQSNKEKPQYERPKIIASYDREELSEMLRPHGPVDSYGGGGGGCGCGGG